MVGYRVRATRLERLPIESGIEPESLGGCSQERVGRERGRE